MGFEHFENISPKTLDRLLTLTKRLTRYRDLDALLHEILEGSTTLVPGADFVCVFLYRPEENALVPIGGVGFDMDHMRHVRVKPGESMTGKAFVARRPLLLPNPAAIREAQSNLSDDNERAVRRAIGRPTNPLRSSLAVPLITNERTVGVLVIDNYDTDRDFNTEDMTVASSLADHAAIAVLNAEDFQRTRALSDQLQRTMTVQQRLLASMLSTEGSMEALLRTLWTILQCPLKVYDAENRLMAEIGGNMGSPEDFVVQTGRQLLGRLVVGRSLDSGFHRTAVEQALPLIALEFMKIQARELERLHAQSDAFRRIWDGDEDAIDGVRRKYGLDSDWQFILVQSSWTAMLLSWARESNVPATKTGNSLILLAIDPLLEVAHQRLDGAPGSVLWGSVCRSPGELSRELRGLVMLARSFDEGSIPPVARLEDYPEFKVLSTVPHDARTGFADKMLSPIADDPTLLHTLKAWIDANRSYADAAQALHTHPNTVRYRIDKAARLLGRPLGDDRTVMLLRMAFLWRINLQL